MKVVVPFYVATAAPLLTEVGTHDSIKSAEFISETPFEEYSM
jgi:hypothetical protein